MYRTLTRTWLGAQRLLIFSVMPIGCGSSSSSSARHDVDAATGHNRCDIVASMG
jgi:hypothetical protein